MCPGEAEIVSLSSTDADSYTEDESRIGLVLNETSSFVLCPALEGGSKLFEKEVSSIYVHI
jgi:hypothetical protein